jgi:hypothetical protein
MCSTLPIRSMVKTACFLQCLLFFVFGTHVGQVFGGCGDYLHHNGLLRFSPGVLGSGAHESDLNLSDNLSAVSENSGRDGLPTSRCSGGNCRSAPENPPVDPARTVVLRRQPVSLPVEAVDLNLPTASIFVSSNDRLPLSASLEVMTPPPIPAS